jgi:hypothetical protein
MTDDRRLQESLLRLRTEIDALGVGDDDARQRLRRLIEDIERTLESPGTADSGLVAQLKRSVLRFEASHPRIAGVMNELVEQLGNMGI